VYRIMLIDETFTQVLFGSGEASITPKQFEQRSLSGYGRFKKCQGIHDLIFVRVYVLYEDCQENETEIKGSSTEIEKDSKEKPAKNKSAPQIKLVLINYDLTGFTYKNNLELKTYIKNELGIDPVRVHTFSTHSHYSPGTMGIMPAPVFPNVLYQDKDVAYVDLVKQQTIKAIKKASLQKIPVKIGYGKIQLQEKQVLNRRSPKGKLQYFHPQINLIRFDDHHGNVVGLITTFPAHPTFVGNKENKIGGGWPGSYVRQMKQAMQDPSLAMKKNSEIVPLIFQGPAGNVAPFMGLHKLDYEIEYLRTLTKDERDHISIKAFAGMLVKTAMQKLPNIETKPLQHLIINYSDLYLPMNPIFRRLDKKGWRNILYAAIKMVIVFPFFLIVRRGKISFVNVVRAKLKGKRFKKLRVKTCLTTIGFNDIILAGHPGEPYYNVEKEIIQRTEYDKVFLAELCNDSVGYNWTDIETVYNPTSYDGQMSFSPLMGILSRNGLIKDIKKIINKFQKRSN
jgi:hypothetical protein